jgi:hypothetical protein
MAAIVGCQRYDFQPVQPTAFAQQSVHVTLSATPVDGGTPNLMFLLDRSGSMDLPFNTLQADGVTTNLNCYVDAGAGIECGDQTQTNPALLVSCTNSGPNACPSRWSTLSTSATAFLNANPSLANYGVTFFPDFQGSSSPTYCEASATVGVPFGGPIAVANAIAAVGTASGANSPNDGKNGGVGGGTPTAGSISWVAANGGFPSGAPNYILLMTDGLPNCTESVPFGQPSSSFPSCSCVDKPGSGGCAYAFDCNDYSAAAAAIGTAASSGIKTIVLGYGDLNPNGTNGAQAVNSLNTMGAAGGFTRYCLPDGGWTLQDAGPGITTTPCAEQFWRVTTSAELAAALNSIGQSIPRTAGQYCQFTLNANPPNPPTTVSVDVSITNASGTTVTAYPYIADAGNPAWTITGNTLTFGSDLCAQVLTQTNSVSFLVRILTTLH